MKKIVHSFILFTLGMAFNFASFSQLNISFKSKYTFPGLDLSNIWGYAANGREYALVGHSAGMSVIDVTDPANPYCLFAVPGPNSIWREVRTRGSYAFVTTEGGGGLQIVDLSALPVSIQYKSWTGDSVIAGQINSIHALQVDGNYLYLYGSNISNSQYNGHPLIIDVTDPWDPHYAGQFIFPGSGTVSYVHDGIVRNDTGYFGHIYDGFFSVVNLTSKSNPVLLASQNTPSNFTHNTWLSDNNKILFTTDEVDNSFLTAYDVSNPSNIIELDKIQQNPGSGSVVHNTYILNDYAVTSWYKEGVVIVDAGRPENLVITGYYDTSPLSGSGMDGDWGVYTFLPSGNLLVSDMQEGMYVLTPDYKRGCYLEGTVTETGSGTAIYGVTVTVLGTSETTSSKSNGNYACGHAIPGTYDVKFQKAGYDSKIITGVTLANGAVTPLNVQLDVAVPFSLSGQVKEDSVISAVPNAEITFSSGLSQYTVTADSNGIFTIPFMDAGYYEITAGKWGYRTQCFSQAISSSTGSLIIGLQTGIYDDFAFDFGWTISSTASAGYWETGNPAGTSYDGAQANPGADVSTDCNRNAFVTGNGGGNAGDDDVDGGKTTITSPEFDPTGYTDPYLSYYRWFYNGGGFGGNPNDTLKIKLTNGNTTVTLENVTYASPGNSSWSLKTFKISDYITITAAMRLIAEASDNNPGHIAEAGLDLFQVFDFNARPAPVAGFNADSVNTCGGTVNFTDASVNIPDSWSWDFGDGATSTLQNPSHTYLNDGVYTVTLVAAHPDGSDTLTKNSYITKNSSMCIPGINTPCLISGVELKQSGDNLTVYPNPFSARINVQYDLGDGFIHGAEIVISDIIGKIVFRESLLKSAGIVTIDKDFKPGLYFMDIRNGKESTKIIKIVKL